MITFNKALDEKGNKDLGPQTISFPHSFAFQNLKGGGEFGVNEREIFRATRSNHCLYEGDW